MESNELALNVMCDKLKVLYAEERQLYARIEQLTQDIELLETMIMYKFNKEVPL